MNKFRVLVIGAAAVLFPFLPMADPNAGFYADWYNHLWLIGYYSQYFAVNHSMPLTLNTHEILLVAFPTFYGQVFYSALGLISSLVGLNLAIRLGFVALWALIFWLIYRLTIEFSQDELVGLAMSCLVWWPIYHLTNV